MEIDMGDIKIGSVSFKGKCPNCGKELKHASASNYAKQHGLEDVVMCSNCNHVYKYKLNVALDEMIFEKDVTKKIGSIRDSISKKHIIAFAAILLIVLAIGGMLYYNGQVNKELSWVKHAQYAPCNIYHCYLCGENQKFDEEITSEVVYVILGTDNQSDVEKTVKWFVYNYGDKGFEQINETLVQGKYHKYLFISYDDITLVNPDTGEEIGFWEYELDSSHYTSFGENTHYINLSYYKPKIDYSDDI